MLNWQEYDVALERQADAWRQAERQRLVRLAAASHRSGKKPLAGQALAALGRLLVATGMWLQSSSAALEVGLRRM